ncbi:hypothetical protein MWH25_01345 [Natroniella acetigena]|uniref:hypothetical protein n=1 Tax=Natroniella acetigena TaxID=52004 RepID=UPI00200B8864|nr:hypothetical protein [Natroniella acetigena]MCK8826392.1 hypothetical protein [Natroniella acetigena]
MDIKERVKGHKLIATDHFKARLVEREIDPNEIYYILRDKYKELRLFCFCGKVMYSSERLSLVLRVTPGEFILITVMDFSPEKPKDVMVV